MARADGSTLAVAAPHGGPLADRVVVEVMGRRDLDAAGAESRIDVFIGNDRDLPTGQR